MISILYTDTDQIRSVLGIDDRDMTDAQIADRNLAKELRLDLVSWLATHATLNTSGTENEKDALNLYCTYFCAALVAVSVQMAAPQKVSDGKDSLDRFATIDWANITRKLNERTEFYRKLMQQLMGETTVTTTYSLFSAVGLANDPVTSTQ